jgi:hypothetical protein
MIMLDMFVTELQWHCREGQNVQACRVQAKKSRVPEVPGFSVTETVTAYLASGAGAAGAGAAGAGA